MGTSLGNRSHCSRALRGRGDGPRSHRRPVVRRSLALPFLSARKAIIPGSARVSRVNASPARTFGVSPKRSFAEKSALTRRHRQHARRVRYPPHCSDARAHRMLPAGCRQPQASSLRSPEWKKRDYCAHSSSAFGSPRKNASASPAKWREPVIKTRSLVRCAAEIASATDGMME